LKQTKRKEILLNSLKDAVTEEIPLSLHKFFIERATIMGITLNK